MWVQLRLQQPLIHRTPNRKLSSLNPEPHYFMAPALQNTNTSGGPLLLCKPTVVVCTHSQHTYQRLCFQNPAVRGRLPHQYTIGGAGRDKDSAAICLPWISCLVVTLPSPGEIHTHTHTHTHKHIFNEITLICVSWDLMHQGNMTTASVYQAQRNVRLTFRGWIE